MTGIADAEMGRSCGRLHGPHSHAGQKQSVRRDFSATRWDVDQKPFDIAIGHRLEVIANALEQISLTRMDGRCSWRPAQIVRVSSSSAFTPNIARQGRHRPYVDLLMKLLGRNRRGLPASRRNDNEQLGSSCGTQGDQDCHDSQKRHSHRSPLFDVPRMAAPRYGRISVMPDCVTSVTGETGRSPNYLVSLLGLWVARLGRAVAGVRPSRLHERHSVV